MKSKLKLKLKSKLQMRSNCDRLNDYVFMDRWMDDVSIGNWISDDRAADIINNGNVLL